MSLENRCEFVCLSVCLSENRCMFFCLSVVSVCMSLCICHVTITHDVIDRSKVMWGSPALTQNCPRICSNLFTVKHGLSAGGWLALDWNAFLLLVFLLCRVILFTFLSVCLSVCLSLSVHLPTLDHSLYLHEADFYSALYPRDYYLNLNPGVIFPRSNRTSYTNWQILI